MAKDKKNGKALKDSETAGAAGGYMKYNVHDNTWDVYTDDEEKLFSSTNYFRSLDQEKAYEERKEYWKESKNN